MAVYVDQIVAYPWEFIKPFARQYGRRWCHLLADTPEELHAMARRIGLARTWCSDFTQPNAKRLHYDLTPGKRRLALQAGAIPEHHPLREKTCGRDCQSSPRNLQGQHGSDAGANDH